VTYRSSVRLDDVVRTSAAVADTRSRLTKIELLAGLLSRLSPQEVPVAVAYLSGELPQGPIGIGWASLRDLPPHSSGPATLVLGEVDAALTRIAGATGRGSAAQRRRSITDLFERATEPEQRFLTALVLGELRQGALEGVMVEAVAKIAGVTPSEVRRALMLSGDLGRVAVAAAVEGGRGLARFELVVLKPVLPMLARSAPDLGSALARIRPAVIEPKLDGARLQVHRAGAEVRAFTRNLADVTGRVPELVETMLRLPIEAIVLDGEAIALRPDGRPHPFQVTMGRFGSRLRVEELRRRRPLSTFFFDCLHLNGQDLLERGAAARWDALAEVVPPELRVRHTVTDDTTRASRALEDALRNGHEGVMVKAPDAPYAAGRRGAGWLKVKRAMTVDLVVLAAEWGHGRRAGRLSNLHLGARAPDGSFVMLGKTFKGMTDEMLAWQTERLLELETARDGITVFVRPELVVEVAFDGLQNSVRYPGGVALRFARVKGYRLDKRPEDADTIDAVLALGSARPSLDAPG
jgi:DNA ligase 1